MVRDGIISAMNSLILQRRTKQYIPSYIMTMPNNHTTEQKRYAAVARDHDRGEFVLIPDIGSDGCRDTLMWWISTRPRLADETYLISTQIAV